MRKYDNSELCLIWLDSFVGLEYKHKKELYNLINGKDGIKELLVKGKDYIVSTIGESEYNSLVGSANASYLSYVTDALCRRDITAVTIDSEDYPEKLRETDFAPLVLYAKGDLSLLHSECFAIVGSRKSLPIAIKTAENFTKALSNANFTLVTGIAEGIDEMVIRTALDNGGKVISVLGGGFDNIYPATNKDLVERLAKDSLVITEYPPEVVAKPYHFPIRNRIIAGLSVGTLIVSGGIKSGTQHTASYAVEYGRDLFAVPYGIGVPSGAGCNDLIKKGAILADMPEDILDFYNKNTKESKRIELSQVELEIVNALKDGELHVQKISSALGKQVYELTPIISMLEIKGVINKNGVNVYGLARNSREE